MLDAVVRQFLEEIDYRNERKEHEYVSIDSRVLKFSSGFGTIVLVPMNVLIEAGVDKPGAEVVCIHNHPGEGYPSYKDSLAFLALKNLMRAYVVMPSGCIVLMKKGPATKTLDVSLKAQYMDMLRRLGEEETNFFLQWDLVNFPKFARDPRFRTDFMASGDYEDVVEILTPGKLDDEATAKRMEAGLRGKWTSFTASMFKQRQTVVSETFARVLASRFWYTLELLDASAFKHPAKEKGIGRGWHFDSMGHSRAAKLTRRNK